MKAVIFLSSLAIASTIGMARAENSSHESGYGQQQMEAQSATQIKYAGHGVLKAVKANKVQIAHEPIAELQWPAMTMWFGLRDVLPQDIHVGDSVYFEMMQAEKKQWVIVRIARH